MISSLVPRFVLCGLLVLTLSFKVSVGGSQVVSGKNETVRAFIARFLAGQGFELDPAIAIQYPIGASGRSGGCQLLIGEVTFQGWQRYIPRRIASDGDQVYFFFRGDMYRDQPVWLTRLSGYWNTLLRNLGFKAPVEPILAIVASPPCDLNAMPWQELADHVAALRR